MHFVPCKNSWFQQRCAVPAMRDLMQGTFSRLVVITLLSAWLAWPQQTVAPTVDESVTTARGENKGNYNVVQSWELRYRYATIGGDQGKYRSDVNYHDGV